MTEEKTEEVAGHLFSFSRDAVCGKPRHVGSQEICGKSWAFVRTATADDLSKPDHCHAGNLNTAELAQIDKRRTREAEEDARIWGAVVGVSAR